MSVNTKDSPMEYKGAWADQDYLYMKTRGCLLIFTHREWQKAIKRGKSYKRAREHEKRNLPK